MPDWHYPRLFQGGVITPPLTHDVATAITFLLLFISIALTQLDCRDKDHIFPSLSPAPYQLPSSYVIDLVKYKKEGICLFLVLTLVINKLCNSK